MPVYNSAAFVESAVQSVLAQTYRDFELLILDDGSSDGSWEILQRIDDPRVRLHRNERNLKLIATLNRGLELARGELIARMDADDLSHPERFARQVALFDANPRLALVSTDILQIDAADRPLKPVRTSFQNTELIDWRLSFGNIINHPTVMMRRSFVAAAGGYPREYLHAEDFALWLKLVRLGEAAIISKPLLHYRIHATSVSVQNARAQLQATAQAIRDLSCIESIRQLPRPAIEALLCLRGEIECDESAVKTALSALEGEIHQRFSHSKIPADARLHLGIAHLRVAAKARFLTRLTLVTRAFKWWLGDANVAAPLLQQVASKTWGSTLAFTRIRLRQGQ
jgi:hypothetical protein